MIECTIEKRILVDCEVHAEVGVSRYGWMSKEDYATALDRACREFNDFVRDHRSMDHVRLEIKRIYRDECSQCENAWEIALFEATDGHASYEGCAHCGAKLTEPSEVLA